MFFLRNFSKSAATGALDRSVRDRRRVASQCVYQRVSPVLLEVHGTVHLNQHLSVHLNVEKNNIAKHTALKILQTYLAKTCESIVTAGVGSTLGAGGFVQKTPLPIS